MEKINIEKSESYGNKLDAAEANRDQQNNDNESFEAQYSAAERMKVL